jgi:hypothetical protein
MAGDFVRHVRALLILGRVSNLPTVWSNCLAGWWLGGGGHGAKLPWLIGGVTLLYLGGMFLNDACDVEFDRQHRRERPIPSGAISPGAVWRWGFGWLIGGLALLFVGGRTTGMLGVGLAACILLYDAVHKVVTFSPVLLGACRFCVYVIAASVGVRAGYGRALWCGLALGAYVAGLSFLARRESARGAVPRWPVALLAAPVALAGLMNAGVYRAPALWLALVLVLWLARCLRPVWGTIPGNVGRAVSGLLAGIVLVDWLAVGPVLPRELNFVFLALFGGALLAQRFVPAT